MRGCPQPVTCELLTFISRQVTVAPDGRARPSLRRPSRAHERRHARHARAARRPRPPRAQHRSLAGRRRRGRRAPAAAHQDAQEPRDRRAPARRRARTASPWRRSARRRSFAAAGFEDIAIAYPVVGEAKWARVAELATAARITVNVDSAHRRRGPQRRRGTPPARPSTSRSTSTRASVAAACLPDDTPRSSALARRASPACPGSSSTAYHPPRPLLPRRRGHDRARPRTRGGRGRRRGGAPALAGIAVARRRPAARSAGGGVAEVPGVTEVRAGTYVFNDLMQVALGAARPARTSR